MKRTLVALALVTLPAAGLAQEATTPPTLKSDVAALFGPDLYPAEALRAEEQGRVVVLLGVDKQGRVTDCQLSQTSGSTSLDEVTCRQARLAQFEPGRDSRGRAVATTYTLPVRWQLPSADDVRVVDVAQPGAGNYDVGMEVRVGADGRVAGCRSLIATEDVCAGMAIGQPFPQSFVRDGKPVAVTLVIRSSQKVTAAP